MTDHWTKSTLAGRVGAPFPIEAEGPPLELELTEVNGLAGDAGSEESFSLTFRAPGDRHLPQGLYRLRHPGGGTAEVFLVPIRRDGGGLYMEAVFNRSSHV
jgi:hypothetical protein